MVHGTEHVLLVGDCTKALKNVDSNSIDLLITSPPYFNAPFDYNDLFNTYETFLQMIDKFANLSFNILKKGRIAAVNIDDMLIKGVKYPIISDTIKIFEKREFILCGRVIWKKPEGYIRISRRSGVLIQNPFPMYYYPDNLIESIIIFQKPFNNKPNQKREEIIEDIWEITNVLPLKGRLEVEIAAFPEEIPRKLIKAFTSEYNIVCDPFIGSGTTMKVARELNRNSLGIELLSSLVPIIRKKIGFSTENLTNYINEDIFRIEEILDEEEYHPIDPVLHTLKSNYSYLNIGLNSKKVDNSNERFHLLLFDCRNVSKAILNERFKEILNQLIYGRIAIFFYDPISEINNKIKIFDIFDFLMRNGFKFRDKITVQHKSKSNWEVISPDFSRIIFKHSYFEIFLFQKGKYDYKNKTKEQKNECLIDLKVFQKEKWFLTLWNMTPQLRVNCDPIVTERLIELFLYNNEIICTNLTNIKCSNRHYTIEKIDLP